MKRFIITAFVASLAACGGGGDEPITTPTAVDAEVITAPDGFTRLGSYYVVNDGPADHLSVIYDNTFEGEHPYSPNYQIVRLVPPANVPRDAVALNVVIKTKVVVPAGPASYGQMDVKLAREPIWTLQNHTAHIEGWGGGDKGEYRDVQYTRVTVPLRDGGFWMCLGVGTVGNGQLEFGVTLQGYWK